VAEPCQALLTLVFSYCVAVHIFALHRDPEHQDALLLCPTDRRFCIFSLSFSSDGNEILCGANDSCLYIYDRQAEKRILRVSSDQRFY